MDVLVKLRVDDSCEINGKIIRFFEIAIWGDTEDDQDLWNADLSLLRLCS